MLFRGRFRVALKGTDILIHSEEQDEPIVGFRAVRFIRAKSVEEARSIAVARVRSEWFSSPFCSANRAQAPVLTVDGIEKVRNPFRRSRPNRGYDFFREGEERGDVTEKRERHRRPRGAAGKDRPGTVSTQEDVAV